MRMDMVEFGNGNGNGNRYMGMGENGNQKPTSAFFCSTEIWRKNLGFDFETHNLKLYFVD